MTSEAKRAGPELRVEHRRISLLGVEGAFVAARRPTLRAPVALLGISTILGVPLANLAAAHGLVEGPGGVAFGLVGFAFAPYIGLLVAMLAFGFLGTVCGRHVLVRMKEEIFRTGFKIVLTLLALRLGYTAISKLMA